MGILNLWKRKPIPPKPCKALDFLNKKCKDCKDPLEKKIYEILKEFKETEEKENNDINESVSTELGTITFQKIRDVKDPVVDADEEAGFDLFVPEYSEDLIEEMNRVGVEKGLLYQGQSYRLVTIGSDASKKIISLPQGQGILIPSGLKVKCPHNNMCLKMDNKINIASKGLIIGATIIDATYKGEIFIHVISTSKAVDIEFGQKITQLIPLQLASTYEVKISDENIFGEEA